MNDRIFQAIRDAVNLGRNLQIRTLPSLRANLSRLGYNDLEITEALTFWANRIQHIG